MSQVQAGQAQFQGPSTLGAPTTPGVLPAFSIFPSFNRIPIVIAAAPPPLIDAAGLRNFSLLRPADSRNTP